MNEICKAIFRAIHEGKWLQIEYRNQSSEMSRFWIGILDLDVRRRSLSVDGLHIMQMRCARFDVLYIDFIQSAEIIDGSYQRKNEDLIRDIKYHPEKYEGLFGNIANLKILNYLAECNRMDTVPYYKEYDLLRLFDEDRLRGQAVTDGTYRLSQEQYQALIQKFVSNISRLNKTKCVELGLNVLSVHMPKEKGLYVLAYRRLLFDIKNYCLRPDEDITICYEYEVLEQKQSILQFLNEEDRGLLEDFEYNQELIKDRITERNKWIKGVDDMPYIIAVGRDLKIDLRSEYEAIVKLYDGDKDEIPMPIKAFFGNLLARPSRRKTYPFAIINRQLNMDQLLAINNAMKYPLSYVQGPPGTGKSSTIVNTITTAFFNDRTVLFTSYNNHPIDSVVESLCKLKTAYGRRIPFPIVRLGNLPRVKQALDYMRDIYEETKEITILESNLARNKRLETQKLNELSRMLKNYEERLELGEKETAIRELANTQQKHLAFYADLFGRQIENVNKRQNELQEVSLQDVLNLLP